RRSSRTPMEIITVDSPKAGLLRRRSQPVRVVTPDVRALMDQMFEMLQVAHGLGLAAPQIGVGRRVFVAKIADRQIALADPEILHQEGEVVATEACRSGWSAWELRSLRCRLLRRRWRRAMWPRW